MSVNSISDILDEGKSIKITDTTTKTEPQDASSQQQAQLNNEKIAEQQQRRKFRWIMFCGFFGLLLIQHILLVLFIYCSIANNFIDKIQPLLDHYHTSYTRRNLLNHAPNGSVCVYFWRFHY